MDARNHEAVFVRIGLVISPSHYYGHPIVVYNHHYGATAIELHEISKAQGRLSQINEVFRRAD